MNSASVDDRATVGLSSLCKGTNIHAAAAVRGQQAVVGVINVSGTYCCMSQMVLLYIDMACQYTGKYFGGTCPSR
jgi:hypothetical protein